jgi:hypothetical protein
MRRVLEVARRRKIWMTSLTMTMKRRAMAIWTKRSEKNEGGSGDGWKRNGERPLVPIQS